MKCLRVFDVKGLFTSIPVSKAIEICERRLRVDKTLPKRTSMDVDTIMLLVRFFLNNTSFIERKFKTKALKRHVVKNPWKSPGSNPRHQIA